MILSKNRSVLFLILIGFIVYFNSLFNQFVWDDNIFIVNNAAIHSINIPLYFTDNLWNQAGFYRPIPPIIYSFIYGIFETNVFFYHLPQIALHILNGILVFFLFKKFINKKLSFILSAVFLVHQINVEAVSWISSLQDVLFFTFGIIALLLSFNKKTTTKKLIIIYILLLFSLLTKEIGILFVFLILVSKIYLNKTKTFPYLIGSLITFSLYLFLRFIIAHVVLSRVNLVPMLKLSLMERLINVPQIIIYYLKTFIFPLNLSIEQQWIVKGINFNNFYFPSMIIISISILLTLIGLKIKKQNNNLFKYLIFFSCWLFLGVLLHLQIIPLDMTVADRWFYFPIVGLLGIIGIIIQSLKLKNQKITHLTFFLSVIVISFLSIRTIIRNTNWQDGISLYEHDIKIQDNFKLENHLGEEYLKEQNYDKALIHFQNSINLADDNFKLWENLGRVYHQKGNLLLAEGYYKKSILTTNPQSAYENLANLYLYKNDNGSAENITRKGIYYYPKSWILWSWLSVAEYKLKNINEALLAANRAYELSQNPQTYNILLNIKSGNPIDVK